LEAQKTVAEEQPATALSTPGHPELEVDSPRNSTEWGQPESTRSRKGTRTSSNASGIVLNRPSYGNSSGEHSSGRLTRGSAPPDVKALENTLADHVLEEAGFAQKQQERHASGAADCRAGVVVPVVPSAEYANDAASAAAVGSLHGHGTGTAHQHPCKAACSDSPELGSARDSAGRSSCHARAGSKESDGSCRASSLKHRHATAGEVCELRVRELTKEIPECGCIGEGSASEQESPRAPTPLPAVLAVSGLIRWERLGRPRVEVIYRSLVGLVTAAAAVSQLIRLIENAARQQGLWFISASCEEPVCWRQLALLSAIPVAAGPLIGFLLLRPWQRSTGFFQMLKLLQSYADSNDLSGLWQRRASLEMCWTAATWLCAVVAEGVGLLHDSGAGLPTLSATLSLASFSVLAGILMCLCFGQLYVCRALMIFVDTFCGRVVDSPVISDASHQWNVLQAVLRKGSSSVEYCFIALQGMGAITLPLLIVDFFRLGEQYAALPALIPGAVLTLGVFRVLFLAAAVTDKCGRIPPLLNSLDFGKGTDRECQYIVQYVANSAAGFHVFDVRITTGMALKYLYMWMVVTCGLWTQLDLKAG